MITKSSNVNSMVLSYAFLHLMSPTWLSGQPSRLTPPHDPPSCWPWSPRNMNASVSQPSLCKVGDLKCLGNWEAAQIASGRCIFDRVWVSDTVSCMNGSTPPKTSSSPLKNDGGKTRFLWNGTLSGDLFVFGWKVDAKGLLNLRPGNSSASQVHESYPKGPCLV